MFQYFHKQTRFFEFLLFANCFLSYIHTQSRHLREGVELPPIDQNLAYDFNYQQMTVLPQVITILPGDDLIVECYWNTSHLNTNDIVYGGDSTFEEMCLAMLVVYPDPGLIMCVSELAGNNCECCFSFFFYVLLWCVS